MSIIRVFPRRTSHTPKDSMAFIGGPDLLSPEADEVHVSVTFTWDIQRGEHLQAWWGHYYSKVLLGGPAFDSPVGPFMPGLYIKEGVTFTTRGCNLRCPWCLVPKREGKLVLQDFPDGYMIQDNNLLQAPRDHIERVCDMLRRQRKAAVFSGGIQASLVTPWFADLLQTVRVHSLFLAADTKAALEPLRCAVDLLGFLGRNKLRSFVLIGFNGETPTEAEERLEAAWDIGVMPFAQLYQPPDGFIEYPREWKALARTWSRPAAMKAVHSAARHVQ